VVYSRYYFDIRLEGLSKTMKTLVSTVDVPAEIQTEHLPNTSLERYRYTNVFGSKRTQLQVTNYLIWNLTTYA
jgi:hypothetical protein